MTYEIDPNLDLYVKAVLGKKARNVVILDVHELTSIADVFIICSGDSNRQASAIADFIRVELKKDNIKLLGMEGGNEGHWVLLDYGHVIIHVFYKPVRDFYDLEGLWIDAKRIKTESLLNYVEEEDDIDDDVEVEYIS